MKSQDLTDLLRHSRLFKSPWFAVIFRQDLPVPMSIRKLAIRAIGDFKMYFGFHKDEMWRALDLLIEKMRITDLAAPAAVSLRNLCDENRVVIAGAGRVGGMLEVCAQYFEYPGAQREPKAAIIAAVSSVAESLSKTEDAGNVFENLLNTITKDHERRLSVARQTGAEAEELSRVVCRDSLSLMVSMGRAAQAKTEDEEVAEALDALFGTKRRKYWQSKKGSEVQMQIAALLRTCLEASGFHQGRFPLA